MQEAIFSNGHDLEKSCQPELYDHCLESYDSAINTRASELIQNRHYAEVLLEATRRKGSP